MSVRHPTLEAMRLSSKQACLHISGQQSVLFVHVSGLVTAATVDEIRLVLAPVLRGAAAVVVDYTRSLAAASDLDLLGPSAPSARGVRSIPMAWAFADTGTATLWALQSFRLALLGHRRFAAGGIDAAAQWAHQQARLAPLPASP